MTRVLNSWGTRLAALVAVAAIPLSLAAVPGPPAAHAADATTSSRSTGEWPTSHCGPWVHLNVNGRACFQKYGDKFFVEDTAPENWTIVLNWETSYGRTGECVAATWYSWGMTMCDENVKERSAVRIRLSAYDRKGSLTGRTDWSRWMATGS